MERKNVRFTLSLISGHVFVSTGENQNEAEDNKNGKYKEVSGELTHRWVGWQS